MTLSSDPEEEGELLSSSELEARRPDGFKFVVAPVLRGEGNWPSVSMYGTMEQRMQHTLEVLMARLPFWLQVTLLHPAEAEPVPYARPWCCQPAKFGSHLHA